MWSYTLRRILSAIPTLWVAVTVCYVLVRITPGGPFDGERKLSAAVLANLQAKYHLDWPWYKQYFSYLNNLLHGDLGASFRFADWSVNDLVANALPVSLAIGGISILLALLLGVSAGIVAALRQNSWVDYLLMFKISVGSTVPSFVIGPVLILFFAIWWKMLPSGNWNDFEIKYMVLPIALLTIINMSTTGRVMRGSLIEVLNSNFIRTARAKGLSTRTIVLRHALKPALIPVASAIGPMAISSITAAVVTEHVFSLPGLGKLITTAASNRDYTLILGLVVLVTVLAVLVNLLVDLLYAWLDPRIRY